MNSQSKSKYAKRLHYPPLIGGSNTAKKSDHASGKKSIKIISKQSTINRCILDTNQSGIGLRQESIDSNTTGIDNTNGFNSSNKP